MIRKVPTGNHRIRVRKPRRVKEPQAQYKTRKRTSKRAIHFKPIPIRPDEWEKYRGETIAFVDDKILAHGKDLDVVLQEVWGKYGKKPSEVVLHVVSPYPRMIR